MRKYSHIIFVLAALILMYGCATKTGGIGSVNPNVRDYDALISSDTVKKVDYYCNFERIVFADYETFGDYCSRAENEDYVSYFIPFDIQSTNVYRLHLMQTVHQLLQQEETWMMEYYNLFSGGDSQRLQRLDIQSAQPTSLALLDGNEYYIVLSKADLLARMKIYPTLGIKSVSTDNEQANVINDYTVHYQILPYPFDQHYTDAELAKVLGLSRYSSFSGRFDEAKRINLNRYSIALEGFWQNPNDFRFDPTRATTLDYALPLLGKQKFIQDALSELSVKPEPVTQGTGLLTEYLPSYSLERIDIVHVDKNNMETVVKSFNMEDITRVLISYESQAVLIYSNTAPNGWVDIRFVHKADEPKYSNLSKSTSEQMGLGYIYSDIGTVIETNLHIDKFYQINQLPRVCVNEPKFNEGMRSAGHSDESIQQILSELDNAAVASCSPAQYMMAEILPRIK